MKAPEGLPVRKIVRHVYNAHNTLFGTVDLEDVKRYVTQYLASRSKTPSSPIERTDKRGVYRLNPNSNAAVELMLQFSEQTEETQLPAVSCADESLDLFGDFFSESE